MTISFFLFFFFVTCVYNWANGHYYQAAFHFFSVNVSISPPTINAWHSYCLVTCFCSAMFVTICCFWYGDTQHSSWRQTSSISVVCSVRLFFVCSFFLEPGVVLTAGAAVSSLRTAIIKNVSSLLSALWKGLLLKPL